MKDKRLIWKYGNCKVIPINCQHPTLGKCGNPRYFGLRLLNQYWRIEFPNNSWAYADTKKSAQKLIELRMGRSERGSHRL